VSEVKDILVSVDGEEVIHFVHGPGMTFGEAGFFSVDRVRIVDVVAVAPTTILRLDRRDLGPFMARYPQVKDRALEGLASIAGLGGGAAATAMVEELAG
jgi:CRP-like cAMP-binding protein